MSAIQFILRERNCGKWEPNYYINAKFLSRFLNSKVGHMQKQLFPILLNLFTNVNTLFNLLEVDKERLKIDPSIFYEEQLVIIFAINLHFQKISRYKSNVRNLWCILRGKSSQHALMTMFIIPLIFLNANSKDHCKRFFLQCVSIWIYSTTNQTKGQ
jgi:hypothetical protein